MFSLTHLFSCFLGQVRMDSKTSQPRPGSASTRLPPVSKASLPAAASTTNEPVPTSTRYISLRPRLRRWVPETIRPRSPTRFCCRARIQWIFTLPQGQQVRLYLCRSGGEVMPKVHSFRPSSPRAGTTRTLISIMRCPRG